MDLQLNNKLFVVCGATSGFGLSTLQTLAEEKAKVIAIARTKKKLDTLKNSYKEIEVLCGDISQSKTIDRLIEIINNRTLYGVFINAGGPKALQFSETTLQDWDNAYKNVLRWKVEITKKLLPLMYEIPYGRFVYLESSSVKQPIENLMLSTSLRLAVIGFVKSVSQEMHSSNITFNIIAPGMHDTPAMSRLFKKRAEVNNLSLSQAKQEILEQHPMKRMGNPTNVGRLAAFLFSPYSSYMNGQTISIDGGNIKHIFG